MVPILLEVIKNKPITENAPVATFTAKTPVVPPFVGTSHAGNSPSINILEETRREMLGKAGMPDADEFTTLLSANPGNMSTMFRENPLTSQLQSNQPKDVGSMLNSARKSTREENVEITDVPDFTNLVKKMNL